MAGLTDEKIRRDVFDSLQEGSPPFASYKKAIVGKVLVRVLDPIRMAPEEVILHGDPEIGEINDIVIKVWSPAEDRYLKRHNRAHLERGVLVPFTVGDEEEFVVNQISDEDIELVLQKPFFALKNKLDEFTSSVPVRRFLIMAEKMNRPVGTINYIKGVLEKMETKDEVKDNDGRIDLYY